MDDAQRDGSVTSTGPELEGKITELIQDSLGVSVPSPRVDLVDAGLLDSLAIVTLITEIEILFGHPLPLEELELDGFRTVEGISSFVARTGIAAGDRP